MSNARLDSAMWEFINDTNGMLVLNHKAINNTRERLEYIIKYIVDSTEARPEEQEIVLNEYLDSRLKNHDDYMQLKGRYDELFAQYVALKKENELLKANQRKSYSR